MSHQLRRNTKLFLMFAPLLALFAGLVVMVDDMRNPAVENDQCVIMATGVEASRDQSQGHYIYRQSGSQLNDVSLQCKRLGTLLLNDTHLFLHPIKKGQAVSISHKEYRLLPERWLVNVRTGPQQ